MLRNMKAEDYYIGHNKYLNCLSGSPIHQKFFKKDIVFESQEARDLLREEQVPQVLEKLKEKIAAQDSLTPENTKKLLKEITKELKLKGKKVYMPIRIALTGVMHGPELHDLIPVMGAEEVVRRVDRGLHAAWE